MNEVNYNELREILLYFPLIGVSIKELSAALGVSMSLLYNYRNGTKPKEQKYNYIMTRLKAEYAQELKEIELYIKNKKEAVEGV